MSTSLPHVHQPAAASLTVSPAETAVPNAPILIMPNLPTELALEIIELVPVESSEATTVDFLRSRSAILSCCHLFNGWVMDNPLYWTRLLISPRVPIHYLVDCIDRSDFEPLYISFSATFDASRPSSIRADGARCSFPVYIQDAVDVIVGEMYRCLQLCLTADSCAVLSAALGPLQRTSPVMLRSMLVAFHINSFYDSLPSVISNFQFSAPPPIGPPFPPFTSLVWTVADVPTPLVTYTNEHWAECSISQPVNRPASWYDVLVVITRSSELHTLLIDGIRFDYVPTQMNATFPLFALRVLDLTLRGDETLAYMMSRLNAPGLRSFRIVFTDYRDIRYLLTCSSLLSTVDELILVGQCVHGSELEIFLSLAHRITTLDLRLVSSDLFAGLFSVSNIPPPISDTNFYACPCLRTLFVSEVSLLDVRSLMESRIVNRLSRLEYVIAIDPVGGAVEADVDWFLANDVVLQL